MKKINSSALTLLLLALAALASFGAFTLTVISATTSSNVTGARDRCFEVGPFRLNRQHIPLRMTDQPEKDRVTQQG